MLRLFVKDNASGRVHEYGTNRHDSLILQDDGSLHYENMQCCAGTKFPKEGYSFCLEDGTIPEWGLEYGVEPYIDIGGEYYSKPTTNADRIRAMSDEELAAFLCKKFGCHSDTCPGIELCKPNEGKANGLLKWLQHPAELPKEE